MIDPGATFGRGLGSRLRLGSRFRAWHRIGRRPRDPFDPFQPLGPLDRRQASEVGRQAEADRARRNRPRLTIETEQIVIGLALGGVAQRSSAIPTCAASAIGRAWNSPICRANACRMSPVFALGVSPSIS